jgi:hypothetical protein
MLRVTEFNHWAGDTPVAGDNSTRASKLERSINAAVVTGFGAASQNDKVAFQHARLLQLREVRHPELR